jgi:hypothetical protein
MEEVSMGTPTLRPGKKFPATSQDGEEFVIVVWRYFGKAAGSIALKTIEGEPVQRIEKGKYSVSTDVDLPPTILTSDHPNAE